MAEDPKMPTLDFRLRLLTIANLVPTIAMTTPYDVVRNRTQLTPGIIPMSASALLALFILTKDKPAVRQSSFVQSAAWLFTFVPDVVVACFIIVVLIVFWNGNNYWDDNNRSMIMLGTYATVPMLVNLTIHCFFALRDMTRAARAGMPTLNGLVTSPRCPDCQREFHAAHNKKPVALPVDETETRQATSYQDQPGSDDGTPAAYA